MLKLIPLRAAGATTTNSTQSHQLPLRWMGGRTKKAKLRHFAQQPFRKLSGTCVAEHCPFVGSRPDLAWVRPKSDRTRPQYDRCRPNLGAGLMQFWTTRDQTFTDVDQMPANFGHRRPKSANFVPILPEIGPISTNFGSRFCAWLCFPTGVLQPAVLVAAAQALLARDARRVLAGRAARGRGVPPGARARVRAHLLHALDVNSWSLFRAILVGLDSPLVCWGDREMLQHQHRKSQTFGEHGQVRFVAPCGRTEFCIEDLRPPVSQVFLRPPPCMARQRTSAHAAEALVQS